MKSKIYLFIIGCLVGAVISTGALYTYSKISPNNNDTMTSQQTQPPQMPSGNNSQNNQPPQMPSGDDSQNNQSPQMPSGGNSQNNQPPQMPSGQNTDNSQSSSPSGETNSQTTYD